MDSTSSVCDRGSMVAFWQNYSNKPTVESMLLSDDAQHFCDADRADILSMLPNLTEKRVLELGAGIGRFTGPLAACSGHVVATDFVESFVQKNYEQHNALGNITFEVAEAAHLSLEPESIDMVFTNWLLMYLTDDEVAGLIHTVLTGLRSGGYFHIRESCTERSSRKITSKSENPTYYRHASQYLELLNAVTSETDGEMYRFRILWAKSVPTYIEQKNNWRQVQLLVQKVPAERNIAFEFLHHQLPSADELTFLVSSAAEKQKAFEEMLTMSSNLFRAVGNPFNCFLLQHENTARMLVGSNAVIIGCGSNVFGGFCPFELARNFNCNIIDVESNFYAFCGVLSHCNSMCDKRVRVHMIQMDQKSIAADYNFLPVRSTQIVIGINSLLTAANVGAMLKNIRGLMTNNGSVVFLEESVLSTEKLERLFLQAGFSKAVTTDVSCEVHALISKAVTCAATRILVDVPSIASESTAIIQRILDFWQKKLLKQFSWTLIEATV